MENEFRCHHSKYTRSIKRNKDGEQLNKTLFIRGELSNYILEEDFPKINAALPNSSVSTIKNVGHWLHAENPKAFYEIVTSFISEG